MSRLIYNKTKYRGKHYYCDLCLTRFSVESALKTNQEFCDGVNGRPTRIDMPAKGKNTLKFEKHQKQQKAPYIIYADFESIIEGLPPDARDRTARTEKTVRHVASGFVYTVVRSDGESKSAKYRQGSDGKTPAAEKFLKAIQAEDARTWKELETEAEIEMKPQDWKNFKEAEKCWICKEYLVKPEYLDSVDVWNVNTGQYCGQSHRKCRWLSTCETEEEVINGRLVNRYYPRITPCNKRKPKDTTEKWIEKKSKNMGDFVNFLNKPEKKKFTICSFRSSRRQMSTSIDLLDLNMP